MFHIHLHVLPRRNGDKLSFAKGMLLRRDPDREATGRILRDALAQIDAASKTDAMAISRGRAESAARLLHAARHDLPEDQRPDRAPDSAGLPSLLLHTVGAKTGKPRTTSLTYARDGDDYLIVASKGGDPQGAGLVPQPEGQPECRNQRRPKAIPLSPQPVLPDDPDYARLWEIVNKNNSNRYERYQKRTSRPIPVVGARRPA